MAAAGLALAFPLFALAALMIKCTLRGDVLSRQVRVGSGGRPFVSYKFRTGMEGIPTSVKGSAVGRFLRDTNIDALPWLWNVLRGEMSLVGLRPQILHDSPAMVGPGVSLPTALDPLAWLRYFVSRSDREVLDLVRDDLREDLKEMLREKRARSSLVLAVIWWRSLTEFAPFFWRGIRRFLPFKWVGWDRQVLK
ncbi:MAG: hypothetical protein HOP15_01365 [Planctomycetes bacterium]|nr:hypothetical protein [Planctomycetota bacterium]